jgi:hypothetical protein
VEYLPDWALLGLGAGFYICQWENQRWVIARKNGMRGAYGWVGPVVNITYVAAYIFGIVFTAAFLYDNGVVKTVILICSILGFTFLYGQLRSYFERGSDYPKWPAVLWMVGTVAIWPFGSALRQHVSWFNVV